MNTKKSFDVSIIGGGAAGSSLAIALLQKNPQMKIAIVEKRNQFPQKVGESVNDIAALFFKYAINVDDIFQKHVQKGGLRFYFDQVDNQTIEELPDLASPSYPSRSNGRQLNRSRFDEELLQRCIELGIDVYRGQSFKQLTEEDGFHCLTLSDDTKIHSSWVVDASGRSRLISGERKWCQKYEGLQTSATWAHFKLKDHAQSFQSKTGWTRRAFAASENATEHFMGKGYWIWKINIEEDIVSVGIVIDKKYFPEEVKNPRKHFMSFLENHPLLNIFLSEYEMLKDFHLPHLPHISHKLIENKIASLGDASGFIDPLFSPGLEYVGNQVLWLCDVISADFVGKNIEKLSRRYEKVFVESFKDRFKLYEGRYKVMDDPEIFSLWMTFDLVGYYYGSVVPSLLFKSCIKRPAQFDLLSRRFYLYFKSMFLTMYDEKKRLGISAPLKSYKTNFYARIGPIYGVLLFKTVLVLLLSIKCRILKAQVMNYFKKTRKVAVME
ncbi:MAG: hypothetical protein COW00_04240 [Bdellovibrio sp. CG12_big_fil_rev_8_21_14_0_65_39_13]|nr:MAG: hypothetical protein COW78_20370 [Bdellovibrio sp. CG22_combo_CG10-13_8_21_14_all_39_27]PIQ61322.1 MAG: hypothetical protein COW00_04240 [Bdellovibrio sp. CG12_big_fil_rev_8_21_14_0_65_39_13]PIR33632.1 MAG: hypothetical protein COV37_15885 [Bdellovibrio sp. CG11_big_fil_rev_8_21_14_0_20_39_38]